MHQPGSGISAEKRALRSAQYFRPFDIEHGEINGGHGHEIELIHVQCYGGLMTFTEVIQADPSQDHIAAATGTIRHVKPQVRHFCGKFGGPGQTVALQVGTGQGGN